MADKAETPIESTPEAPALVAAATDVPMSKPAPVITPAPVEPPVVEAAVVESPAAEAAVVEIPVAALPVQAPAPVLAEVTPAPKRAGRPVSNKAEPMVTPPVATPAAKPAKAVSIPAAAPALKLPKVAKPVARKAKAVITKALIKRAAKPAAPAKLAPAAPPKFKPVITKQPTIQHLSAGTPTLSQPKEKLMAKTTPTDFIAPIKTAIADIQVKAKAAYEKGTAALGEANEFTKGNVEAIVESSKILASGLQELGTTIVTDSRSAFESATAEVKGFAAVKTPAEFFQLQSALLRKNFDSAVAHASKSSEAMIKLANEVITPLSTRVTLAVEKASKAA